MCIFNDINVVDRYLYAYLLFLADIEYLSYNVLLCSLNHLFITTNDISYYL